MGNWDDYRREEREPQEKATGKLRCVIVDVEETTSKSSGLPMIVVSVRPSGTNFKVKNYLVKNEYFNRNAGQFFDAFPEIADGDFNFISWIGAMGAANFVEDDNGYLKVRNWVYPRQAESLPEFVGERPPRQEITSLEDEGEDEDPDLPWV